MSACAVGLAVAGSFAAFKWREARPSASYPNRRVELVVPFAAGSSADIVARSLGQLLAQRLGQPFVVCNRPGAGGAVGYGYVRQKPADGYTVILSSPAILTAYHAGVAEFSFRDFDFVGGVTVENPIVAVRADAPWRNLRELVDFAKANPGRLKVGNSGPGSQTQVAALAFLDAQNVQALHVPFSTGQVVTALLAGEIDAVIQLPSAVLPHVRSGALKILGALSAQREPAAAEVPTALEQGFTFHAEIWRALAAPKGLPAEVLARLESALQQTVESQPFRALGQSNGFTAAFKSHDAFEASLVEEDAAMQGFMGRLGILQR